MRATWSFFLALLLSGCAGYKLGPSNGLSAGARTVKFQPFVNKTNEPRMAEYFSNSLRKQLQQDGTFRLQTSGTPDILVSGEILRFERNGLSYQQGDVLTPQEYTLRVQAHVVAVDTGSGKKIIDRTIRGTTFLHIGNDEFSDERQAIPVLTDVLARNAISLLADGQW